jgi:biotin carboxyl carrier protein
VAVRVVKIAGREVTVVIRRDEAGLMAEVVDGPGPPRRLRLVVAGPGRLLIDDRPLEYAIARKGRTSFVLSADGAEWPVEVLSEGEAVFAASGGGAPAEDSHRIVRAPMPGRVVAVHVADGETVASGTALFVIEAMKMENEVRAPRAGRVSNVAVRAGEPVEQDQALCELASVAGAEASPGPEAR